MTVGLGVSLGVSPVHVSIITLFLSPNFPCGIPYTAPMEFQTILWVLAALVAVVVAMTAWGSTRPPPRPREPYSVFSPGSGPNPTKYARPIPRPGDASPLSRAFRAVVDPPGRAFREVDRAAPYTQDEVDGVLAMVLRRVNARDPAMRLTLLSVDATRKATDAKGTARYFADVSVHSVGLTVTSKVGVVVDRDKGGNVFVRELRVHGAATLPTTLGTFAPDPGFAPFEPVLRM